VYVELLDVLEGLQTYKIAVLYDSDYLMSSSRKPERTIRRWNNG
jgi:hypothetical protein